MIIKKKYTQNKKKEEEKVKVSEQKNESVKVGAKKTPAPTRSVEQVKEKISEQNNKEKPSIAINEKLKKEKEELNFSLENIRFEQRQERREGSRRRGYRRIQDRNIISRAHEDAKLIKESAKQEGYKEGIADAKSDLAAVRDKLAEFFNCKDKIYEEVSYCIMDISVEIAKKIIKKEIETDPDIIIPVIKKVVEEVNNNENRIILRVMPKDAGIVKDNIPEIFAEKNVEAKISVVSDKTIKEGGVIVETSNGIIDAKIETQLEIIEKAMSLGQRGE